MIWPPPIAALRTKTPIKCTTIRIPINRTFVFRDIPFRSTLDIALLLGGLYVSFSTCFADED